jgi:tRNA (cmo5U34)-methyltransferase
MTDKKDRVFAEPLSSVAAFKFNDSVAQVFDDMANRSIPGYLNVIHHIGAFSKKYVCDNTNIYDLGCSLGRAALSVRHAVNASGCRIVAVDNSSQMVHRLEQILERDIGVIPVNTRCENILETKMENSSFTILNYTLQFIDTDKKEKLMQRVYDSLNSGGALVLTEKIKFKDPDVQQYVEELYFDYKRFNGYNELEISQKRDALETVMKLETVTQHIDRLKTLGFTTVTQWFSDLNFASFLAVK